MLSFCNLYSVDFRSLQDYLLYLNSSLLFVSLVSSLPLQHQTASWKLKNSFWVEKFRILIEKNFNNKTFNKTSVQDNPNITYFIVFSKIIIDPWFIPTTTSKEYFCPNLSLSVYKNKLLTTRWSNFYCNFQIKEGIHKIISIFSFKNYRNNYPKMLSNSPKRFTNSLKSGILIFIWNITILVKHNEFQYQLFKQKLSHSSY